MTALASKKWLKEKESYKNNFQRTERGKREKSKVKNALCRSKKKLSSTAEKKKTENTDKAKIQKPLWAKEYIS